MKIYGNFTTGVVEVNGKVLSPSMSQTVCNHSPDGFSWGYEGSGPAQLALAVLLLVADKSTALKLHQEFKRQVIALQPSGVDMYVSMNVKRWVLNNA